MPLLHPDSKPLNNHSHRYTLTRMDDVFTKLALMVRSPWSAIIPVFFGVYAAIIFEVDSLAVKVVVGIIFGLICFFTYVVFAALLETVRALLDKGPGLYGEHELELREDGLIERTAVNETVSDYAAIRRIRNGRYYLYVQMYSYRFYSIPRRSFATSEAAYDFMQELKMRIAAAQNP